MTDVQTGAAHKQNGDDADVRNVGIMRDRTDLALSRPVATAETLGALAPDRHRFVRKRVLLMGDPAMLSTPNGRVMLLSALRLLVRICPNLVVRLDSAPPVLAREAQVEARRIAFGAPVLFDDAAADDTFDAVLTVGGSAAPDGRWTAISSDGWVVRVDSTGRAGAGRVGLENPVGAMAAASLGVAEVFKHLIALKPERGEEADGTPFSLFTYQSGDDDPGPALPEVIEFDAAMIGFGAIGNGIGAILRELPLRGILRVVDRQRFGRENLGTCMLLGPAAVGREKAATAKELLEVPELLEVVPLPADVADVTAQFEREGVPPLVLNGLDNRDARREVQRLWADLTIDGAIGTFMAQVSVHPGDPAHDAACLRCLNEPDATGQSAESLAARLTGLASERISDANDVVRDEDVARAPAEMRDALRANVGRTICSVTSAAVATAISAERQADDFEPSVPFVATMSAAMVVGEAIKLLAGFERTLEPRFQFDILVGPSGGIEFPESRHSDCDCTTRRRIIERLRDARRRGGRENIPCRRVNGE